MAKLTAPVAFGDQQCPEVGRDLGLGPADQRDPAGLQDTGHPVGRRAGGPQRGELVRVLDRPDGRRDRRRLDPLGVGQPPLQGQDGGGPRPVGHGEAAPTGSGAAGRRPGRPGPRRPTTDADRRDRPCRARGVPPARAPPAPGRPPAAGRAGSAARAAWPGTRSATAGRRRGTAGGRRPRARPSAPAPGGSGGLGRPPPATTALLSRATGPGTPRGTGTAGRRRSRRSLGGRRPPHGRGSWSGSAATPARGRSRGPCRPARRPSNSSGVHQRATGRCDGARAQVLAQGHDVRRPPPAGRPGWPAPRPRAPPCRG